MGTIKIIQPTEDIDSNIYIDNTILKSTICNIIERKEKLYEMIGEISDVADEEIRKKARELTEIQRNFTKRLKDEL